MFAGKEIAKALATMSLKPEDCTPDLKGVTEKQLQTLADWEAKFAEKYPKVGKVPTLSQPQFCSSSKLDAVC